ncbi:hypothetical protein RB195_004113 [Necator americanus]|uniref:RNase H type-1 domain-containing protein n=1 Tax=Necator americanus TaxID=51031 RepID=A0ABR1BGE5_NECAM
MPEEGKEFIPEASTKFVQISREELEEMLAQARRSSTSAASGLQPTVPSSSSKPVFTKPGLARQFEFNSSVLNILTPLMEWAPDDFDIRSNLFRAITLLTQRNELLTIADTDPDVFDFYDQHAKAESMQTTNPILAAFFKRKRKRKKKRNPQSRAQQRGRLGGTRTCLPVSHFVSWGGKIHSNKDSRGVQGPTVTTVAASAISRETVKDLQNSEKKRGLWKAVVTAIAKKDQLGTAPMYRWALNQAERDEIIDNHNKISSSINLLQELLGSSSTARELFDILAGLQAFSGYLSSEEVVWHCDNQTAIAILKKGSTKPDLQTVAQDIRKLCDNLHVKIEFVWISREFNTEADEATRETDLDDCV